MKTLIVAAALLVAPGTLLGQSAMRSFDRWIGTWRGSGWSMSQTGERVEFNLTESVQRKVGGNVLLIEGHGTATSGRVTHDGLVVLYYDEPTAKYRWAGHEISRPAMNAEATVVDGGISWSIPAGQPGATVRFTITFDDRRWHEVGEFSADGTSWTLFMEMNLLKQ